MKPRARRVQRVAPSKLEHILRHAALVFAEKGYEGASIRDISRSSGISLAGLYYYVESKQKILYLIQTYTFNAVLNRIEKRLETVSDPAERLRILVLNHLDYFLRHPLEMKVLSHEDDTLSGEYRKEVEEIKRRYYRAALDIFEDLRRTGKARRVNPRVAVLALFGMMNWIPTWHRPQKDPQAEALAEAMSGLFLHGVMNGNGAGGARSTRLRRDLPAISARAAG
ncbi:MAG: TetR family transcriptional regulator [Candidatus Acidiferrales bacterium]